MLDNASLSSFIQLSQLALTQGHGSTALENLLYGGDQNQACQLTLSISQILNSMSSAAQINAISGL